MLIVVPHLEHGWVAVVLLLDLLSSLATLVIFVCTPEVAPEKCKPRFLINLSSRECSTYVICDDIQHVQFFNKTVICLLGTEQGKNF